MQKFVVVFFFLTASSSIMGVISKLANEVIKDIRTDLFWLQQKSTSNDYLFRPNDDLLDKFRMKKHALIAHITERNKVEHWFSFEDGHDADKLAYDYPGASIQWRHIAMPYRHRGYDLVGGTIS